MKKNINRKPTQKLIVRAAFTAENSKLYVLATIILFHVVPFVLALCGDIGKQILTNLMMFYLNPMIVFATLLVYGLRVGFNGKMPLVVTLFASASIVMYYSIAADLAHYVLAFMLAFCTFAVMAFLGAIIGAFMKHFNLF